MTTVLVYCAVASLAGSIGWIARDIKFTYDQMRREDRILRDIQDRMERDGRP